MEDQTPNFAADDARQPAIPPVDSEPAAYPVEEQHVEELPSPSAADERWVARPAPVAETTVPDKEWSTAAPAERHTLEPAPVPPLDEPVAAAVPEKEWSTAAVPPVPPLNEPVAAEALASDWSAEPVSTEETPAAPAAPTEQPAPVQEKKPVWKRELTLRRKRDVVSTKQTSAAPTARAPKQAKKPVWKRELTLGRKRDAVAPVSTTTEPPAPVQKTEKKKPVWKRELSLGRKQTAAGAERPAAESEKPNAPKKPRLKRDLSLSLPALGAKKASSAKSGGARGSSVKKIVGLTIGSSQLAAAEVSNNGHAEILKLAQRPLRRGTVVGGELRDVDVLAQELKEFFRENRLSQRNVRLGIASNRIGVRIIDVDGVESGKRLENAVRFRAQEALPIPIDQAVLDHIVLDEREQDGVVTRRVLLVVAYRESIDRYIAACSQAGLRLVGIDLEAFGLLRALGKRNGAADVETAEVVVALGHDRSILAVSANGICEFTRVFDWGGFALDVAVSRELDLTPSAAEPTRTAIGVGGALAPGGLNPEQAASARAAMQRQLHGFARELVSSLQFYQDQPGSLGFGEIVLAGGLAQTPGIDEELQRLIGVPVRVGNPLELTKHGKRVAAHEQLPALAGAIGLGMEV